MNEPLDQAKKQIFFDGKGYRSRTVTYVGLSLAILISLLMAVFIVSVLVNPFLPQIHLRSAAVLPQAEDTKPTFPEPPVTTRQDARLRQLSHKARSEKNERNNQKKINRERLFSTVTGPTPQPAQIQRPLAIGFYVNWDDSSFASLKRNLDSLDWVVPEWIRLSGSPDPLVLDLDQKALQLIRDNRPDLPVMPL